LFALFTQGTLVVKLPPARLSILVSQGVGKPFDSEHRRSMKRWLTVINHRASWLDLVKEVLQFAKLRRGRNAAGANHELAAQ
jgi:hypothetical protein